MTLHVIVGAGPAGSATALRLAAQGGQVRVITRSGAGPVAAGIERVAADAAGADRLAALTDGAAVLYNCASPPYHRWPAEWPPLASAVLAAAERTGAVLVTVSNLYGYGPVRHPMTADDPLAAVGPKGATRARVWTQALAACQAGRVRVAEARASDYFGPGVRAQSPIGARSIPRLLAGRAISVLGDPDAPHSWTYLPDIAAALVTLGSDERAWGRAWHVPTGRPLSQRELYTELARIAAAPPPRLRPVPPWLIKAAGIGIPYLREFGRSPTSSPSRSRWIPAPSRPPSAPAPPPPARHCPQPCAGGATRAAPPPEGMCYPMNTLTRVAAGMSAGQDPDAVARLAWRRRVARIGSEIQLAFAALWFARGTLASEWPGRTAIAIALAAGAIGVGIWGATATRGLAPRPHGPAARRLERAITIATAIQLAASGALPVIVAAAGRSDLTITTIAVTIGVLLLWLWAMLRTPGHLVAGILLIVVPGGLALALAGNALILAAGLATAIILTACAITGFASLARGLLGSANPAQPDQGRAGAS